MVSCGRRDDDRMARRATAISWGEDRIPLKGALIVDHWESFRVAGTRELFLKRGTRLDVRLMFNGVRIESCKRFW